MATPGESRARGVLALLGAIITLTLFPTAAHAAAGDAPATRIYIEANYRLVQAAVSRIHPIEAALHGVLTRVRNECPNAAGGSPQDPESTQLSNEVIGALVTAAVALDRPAGSRFVREAGRLSWSDPALTRSVRAAQAPRASGPGQLMASRLCRRAPWRSTTLHGSLGGSGELPPALARYENQEDRQLANRTRRSEERFSELEAREVETWGSIMSALDLWP